MRSILHSGQLIINASKGKEKENYKKKIKEISDRYNKVCQLSKDRQDKIDQVLPLIRDHNANNKVVEEVLKQAEPVLKSVKPVGIEPEKGNEQTRKIKVYIN